MLTAVVNRVSATGAATGECDPDDRQRPAGVSIVGRSDDAGRSHWSRGTVCAQSTE